MEDCARRSIRKDISRLAINLPSHALEASMRFSLRRSYALFRKRAEDEINLLIPLWPNVIYSCLEHPQPERRINMSDRFSTRMTPRNVEDFDIWVFEARDLVASVVPVQEPWSAAVENYQLNEPAD
jgi:hypothetical protein